MQVNNAGVNFNTGSSNSVEYAETVIQTNYYGTKRMTEYMLPLMKPSSASARVLNVSSRLGRLNGRRNVSIGRIVLNKFTSVPFLIRNPALIWFNPLSSFCHNDSTEVIYS
jgi:NAD(P)-dependent dehydrogenase (short-subunit alcohol dehydrogenase family)